MAERAVKRSEEKSALRPRIGAHVSAAGGVQKLLARAEALGVEVLQVHPSAPQSYRQTAISSADRAELKAALLERGWPLYFHSIYLLNLAAEDERLWHASLGSLSHYLTVAPEFGARGSVTHIGSHKGKGLEAVRSRLEQAAAKLAAEHPAALFSAALMIENTAGGGGTLGRDLDELEILWQIFSAALPTAICLDTCHLWAAGVDLSDKSIFNGWLDDFDRRIGLKNVWAVHLNDSKTPLGSHRDRHANLSEGSIPLPALARVVNEPRLKHADFILEVPGEGRGPDIANLERAMAMRAK